jgi:hypothetical protein
VLYLQPPVTSFGILQFEKFKEILQVIITCGEPLCLILSFIYKVGYKYGSEVVRKWDKDGTLSRVFGIRRESSDDKRRSNRRASI